MKRVRLPKKIGRSNKKYLLSGYILSVSINVILIFAFFNLYHNVDKGAHITLINEKKTEKSEENTIKNPIDSIIQTNNINNINNNNNNNNLNRIDLGTAALNNDNNPVYNDWKDEWIKKWIEKQKIHQLRENVYMFNPDDCNILNRTWLDNQSLHTEDSMPQTYEMNKYLGARCLNASNQVISRAIWQTWKSTTVGSDQFKAMSSLSFLNPDYEYFLFTDEDCMQFICKFYGKRVRDAYELLNSGAARADIWRLAIILRYGGIYIDTDSFARTSFSHLIKPTASVVSGVDENGHLHQWFLAYAPNHPFIRLALNKIVSTVLDMHYKKTFIGVTELTGTTMFYLNAVLPVLRSNGCTLDPTEAATKGLTLVHQDRPCPEINVPEKIGEMQLLNEDLFNGIFLSYKDGDVDAEKAHMHPGYVRHSDITTFEQLFYESIKISKCLV